MKQFKHISFTAVLVLLLNISFSQNINWKSLQPSQRHVVNLHAGLDNGAVAGIGYGYHFHTKMPLLLNVEYSMPMGKNLVDDFKTKIGGQLNVVRAGNFLSAIKVYGVIRRFENDFARLMNFGSELSATAGYYKARWFAAGEFGFDKAITTHVKHKDLMKQYNPALQNGWYIPTGGYFIYGVHGGYSFGRYDVYAKAGKTVSQDFKSKLTVPYYFEVGWNIKW